MGITPDEGLGGVPSDPVPCWPPLVDEPLLPVELPLPLLLEPLLLPVEPLLLDPPLLPVEPLLEAAAAVNVVFTTGQRPRAVHDLK